MHELLFIWIAFIIRSSASCQTITVARCIQHQFSAMKVVLLLGFVAFAALFQAGTVTSNDCDECSKCWDYKGCDIKENPWSVRSFFAVFVTKVNVESFWGDGPSCGVFNPCNKDRCGCIRMDVSLVKDRHFKGQWVSFDRKNGMQFMRRYYAHTLTTRNWAEFTMFISGTAIWKIPETIITKITCNECGEISIDTYVVPETLVKAQTSSFKLRALVIVYKIKFRIVVFCSGLRRINGNKPFAVVLATIPAPGQKVWAKIRKSLRHYRFEPREMTFLDHKRCVYAPFDWCNSWVEVKNPDCDDVCKIDK